MLGVYRPGHVWRGGKTDVARDLWRAACKATSGKFLGKWRQTSGRLNSRGPPDWRSQFGTVTCEA